MTTVPPKTNVILPIFALCLLLCTCVSAQITLSGRVMDEATSRPVAFATVYLDGTSTGEVTDDDGTFRLENVRLPATMVISHLAYETKYQEITQAGPLGDLILRPREAVIAGVEITDKNLREKTLREFTRQLLGSDEWGANSAILNDEVLEFDRDYAEKSILVRNDKARARLAKRNRPNGRWTEDSTRYLYGISTNLKAKSRGGVQVRLPHLGYTLRMDLNSFISDYKTRRTSYLGTYFFTEDKKVTARQRRNRERAYYGSGKHLVRALLIDSVAENGFRIYAVEPGKELNGRKAVEVDLGKFLVRGKDGVNMLVGLKGREFAVLYYADDRYRPLPRQKWKRARPKQSRLFVLDNKCLLLDGGIFGDTNLLFNGDIGARSLAWSLPAGYVPQD